MYTWEPELHMGICTDPFEEAGNPKLQDPILMRIVRCCVQLDSIPMNMQKLFNSLKKKVLRFML
jgi:hypothetical protein